MAQKAYGTFKPLMIKRMAGEETLSVSQILPEASRQMGLDRKAREWSICQLWERIAEPFRTMTYARQVTQQGDQNILKVEVFDSVTASGLQYQLPQLMKQLNQYAPQTGMTVDKIDIQVVSKR